jgi:hypothetical protein
MVYGMGVIFSDVAKSTLLLHDIDGDVRTMILTEKEMIYILINKQHSVSYTERAYIYP